MNARIQAVGIMGFIYVLMSAIYYENGIRTINDERENILQMN